VVLDSTQKDSVQPPLRAKAILDLAFVGSTVHREHAKFLDFGPAKVMSGTTATEVVSDAEH
jgi:hypothetical protein